MADAPDDKSRTRVIAPTPQSRKSLRRIEPAKKSVGQTPSKPLDRLVQSDYGIFKDILAFHGFSWLQIKQNL